MVPLNSVSLRSLRATLGEYGISEHGFLPDKPPLLRLAHDSYRPWESLIQSLPQLLENGKRFRNLVDDLDVLPTAHLKTEAEWRRAYSVLCMLSQGYIWGGDSPSERLPPSLTIPFLQVSAHLEILPVATYAGLNMWNYRTLWPDADLTCPENLVAMHTLTGTEAESWFFVISNALEARAGPIITTMLSAMEAAEQNNELTVITALEYLSMTLDEIGALLERMNDRCDPDTFYHKIRPMLAGSRNMEAAGLPNGVFFDEGEGRGTWRKYRGASNGQSTLIQFFDVVLGEMREYMPASHARFLNDLEHVANLRSFALAHPDRERLVQAYNLAVSGLGSFRNRHIQLVTRYIILPARKPTARIENGVKQNLATMTIPSGSEPETRDDFVGTGGTKLVPFLKRTRDETLAAAAHV